MRPPRSHKNFISQQVVAIKHDKLLIQVANQNSDGYIT